MKIVHHVSIFSRDVGHGEFPLIRQLLEHAFRSKSHPHASSD